MIPQLELDPLDFWTWFSGFLIKLATVGLTEVLEASNLKPAYFRGGKFTSG